MRFTIFLDMDGVITDFFSRALWFYGVKPEQIEMANAEYDCVPHICRAKNITISQFWNGLDVQFWSDMPRHVEADELLKFLDPYKENVCILTSPGGSNSAKGKHIWLQNNLPEYFYKGRYLIGMGKHHAAAPNKILIDDHDKNVDEFQEHGGVPILYPRPWNTRHEETAPHWIEGNTQILFNALTATKIRIVEAVSKIDSMK